VSADELAAEILKHHDSEELRGKIAELKERRINLRGFCSFVRMTCGEQVLRNTIMGLQTSHQANRTKASAVGSSSIDMNACNHALQEGSKTLVHAMLCAHADCNLPGCATTKQLLSGIKEHAASCTSDPTSGCQVCKKWRDLERLRQHYRRKLIEIAKQQIARGEMSLDQFQTVKLPGRLPTVEEEAAPQFEERERKVPKLLSSTSGGVD